LFAFLLGEALITLYDIDCLAGDEVRWMFLSEQLLQQSDHFRPTWIEAVALSMNGS
jgi:hypothetical protein